MSLVRKHSSSFQTYLLPISVPEAAEVGVQACHRAFGSVREQNPQPYYCKVRLYQHQGSQGRHEPTARYCRLYRKVTQKENPRIKGDGELCLPRAYSFAGGGGDVCDHNSRVKWRDFLEMWLRDSGFKREEVWHQPPARESGEAEEAEPWAGSAAGQGGKASNELLERHLGVKLEVRSIIQFELCQGA